MLNNGVEIPALGLGVFQAEPGQETHDAVLHALEIGYRHIDTARVYRNERAVGDALRESSVPRSELFVTTKLWNGDQGFEKTLAACDASLNRLGLDFIDLYLIHWPVEELRSESWSALEQLFEE
ncbi:MAG: aldo/keto reductase, partial [Candidatus Thermoplasmatota archaeon]|nr:aldo/keto reductase [Candidatus Thermoplasmatota archaeon]